MAQNKQDLELRNKLQAKADKIKQEVADSFAKSEYTQTTSRFEDELVSISREFFQSTNNFVQVEKSKWSENYDLYNSIHYSELDANYSNPNYKRSKIFLPKSKQLIMSLVSNTLNSYFKNEEICYLIPEKINDPIQEMACDFYSHLMDYMLRKEIDWTRVVNTMAHGTYLHNFQITKVEWDFKKQVPKVTPVAIENFRIHPGANTIDPIQNSPCLIHIMPMFVEQLIERMNNPNEDIKWNKMDSDEIKTTVSAMDNDYIVWVRNHDSLNPLKEGKTSTAEHNLVMVHENIVRYKGQDYIFYTLGKEKLLSKIFKLEDVYRAGRPFILSNCYLEEHRLYPTSPLQSAKPMQYSLNKITNMMFDNKAMADKPRLIYKKGSGLDLHALRASLPDTFVAAQNPQTDIYPLVVPDLSANFVRDQQQFSNYFDSVAGSFSSTSADSAGVDSVAGMNAVQGMAGELKEMYLRNFHNTGYVPTLVKMLKTLQKYAFDDTELINKIFDMKGLFAKYGIAEGDFTVTSEFIDCELQLKANCSFGSANDQAKLQNYIAATKAIQSILVPDMQSNLLDKEAVIEEIYALAGVKDSKRFINEKAPDPEKEQLKQQLQEANQKNPPEIIAADVAIKKAEEQVKQATVKLIEAQTQMAKMQALGKGVDASKAAAETADLLASAPGIADAADNILHHATDIGNFTLQAHEQPMTPDMSQVMPQDLGIPPPDMMPPMVDPMQNPMPDQMNMGEINE